MKKILPFDISMIETYHCDAFVMGIIQSYNRVKNLSLNYYINMSCVRNKEMKKLDMQYLGSLWGDMWKAGTAELNLFHFKNFNEKTLIEFLRERLDSNSYILFYEVDEYYLSYSEKYKKRHFKHDLYIYGYEDDFFYGLAYSNRKLEKLKINKKEIANCVLQTKLDDITNFCSFRIVQSANVKVDLNSIACTMEDYCLARTSYENEEHVFGIEIWRCVIDCLEEYMRCNTYIQEKFDLRIFRMIWEHKKIMHNRIVVLSNELNFNSDIISELKYIVDQTYIAFQFAIKYTVKPKHTSEYLEKIISIYRDLEVKERMLYPEIVRIIRSEDAQ